MTRYSREYIELLREVVPIELVIGDFVPNLQYGGPGRLKACCPFLHEKTPSFFVRTKAKQWHCFGCGLGGDVFRFLMEYKDMTFPEAVRFVAVMGGVPLPSAGEK